MHLDPNFLNARAISWHLSSENRRANGYLHKHTRAPMSCFLPPGERSQKQRDSAVVSGLWGMLKQDAAVCSSDWTWGTMHHARGALMLFLCSSLTHLFFWNQIEFKSHPDLKVLLWNFSKESGNLFRKDESKPSLPSRELITPIKSIINSVWTSKLSKLFWIK